MSDKKRAGEAFLQHADRIALAAAILIAAAYAYFGIVAARPSAEGVGAAQALEEVRTELGRPHQDKPDRKAPEVVDLRSRSERVWDTIIGDFPASPWLCSFATHISWTEKDVIRQQKTETYWVLPAIEVDPVTAEVGSMTVRWRVVWPDKDERERQEKPDPWTIKKFLHADYARLALFRQTIERGAGGKPGDWEKIHEVEVEKTTEGQTYEYVDRNIKPKTLYAYRVQGFIRAPGEGTPLVTERISKPSQPARSKDIWEIELVWIIPRGELGEMARIRIRKFDIAQGVWFETSGEADFHHKPARDYDWIGREFVRFDMKEAKPVFDSIRKVRHPTTGKLVEVDFNTGFRLVEMEKNVEVDQKVVQHKHTEPGKPPELIRMTRKRRADRVVYEDDEGARKTVWKDYDPNREVVDPCPVCNPKPPPKPEEKKKEPEKKEGGK